MHYEWLHTQTPDFPPPLVHEELVVNYCIVTGLLLGFLQKFMQWALSFLQLCTWQNSRKHIMMYV